VEERSKYALLDFGGGVLLGLNLNALAGDKSRGFHLGQGRAEHALLHTSYSAHGSMD
jgi:hypothetical protein